MNKINTFFGLVILAGIFLSNTQGGFTADYTGSTGLNGTSCGASSCHMGTMGVDTTLLNVKVLNASNIDVTKTASGYVPGTTYDVVIKTYLGNKVKAGFQCVPLTFITALPAGTVLNTVMPTMMQITPDASNRQYVSHTTTGTTSSTVIAGGYATWKFKWQAPSSDIGAINFHCITNVTNNNNLSDGDSIRLATFTIQKPSSVDAVAFETVSVYPNPSHDHLQLLNLPETQGSLWIMNQVGQLIQTQKGNITSIDLLSVPAGSYFIWIKTNSGKSYQSRFVKY